ncbi:hypothetical protein HIM_06894 [Hirsutella minnesotensis 3608]|uniref:Extracellular membrane protein CFEM domain-containing protein n=1 Tax=Hirsutella minnesotensis 3608 TaxID=1043627 RepID=A0A0F7ZIJ6_9HYPO|nr:hypothetical protein HIM_06894 [Hirsutella minnesotensis 3608]
MATPRQSCHFNRILISLSLSVCLLIAKSTALDNDFSFYPVNAQPCLYEAATRAQCQGSDSQELNGCLCGNGGSFITNTARCLGTGDSADVASVYRTMAQACADSRTPMSVSQSDFFAVANGRGRKTKTSAAPSATTTTESVSSRPTTTTTENVSSRPTTTVEVTVTSTDDAPSASSTEHQDDTSVKPARHLTMGARIGIGVGVAVGGVAAVAGLSFLLFQHRRRKAAHEEAAATILPPPFNEGDRHRQDASDGKDMSAAPAAAEFKPAWNQDQVYEMDGTSLPAQMHGSESERFAMPR